MNAAWAQTPTPAAPTPAPSRNTQSCDSGSSPYVQYDAELENRDSFNVFDLTRGYLNVNGQLVENVRFRFTPDVRRATTTAACRDRLVFRVKYAFVEFDDLKAARILGAIWRTPDPVARFRGGHRPYRVQGTMFAEREGLIPGSSDFGVGYFTPLGSTSISRPASTTAKVRPDRLNKYKSVQGRLTLRPFAGRGIANGFRLSGFYSAGWYAADRPRRLGIVMGSFEQTHLVTTLQYLKATENPSHCAARYPSQRMRRVHRAPSGPQGWAALARVDHFDPDRSLADNSQRRVIAGGAYWFVWPRSRVGLVVTNEQVHYEPAARARERESVACPNVRRVLKPTGRHFREIWDRK